MTNDSNKFDQLLHTLSYGDAISCEAIALQRCFREQGYQSDIYAINVHPKLKGQAKLYSELNDQYQGNIILHYSLGSPLNQLYRQMTKARRSLIYHNLTPPAWFEGVNPRIVADINSGIRELPELCKISDYLVSDSHFNASELQKLGFQSRVLELPIDPKRWEVAGNPGIESLVKSESGMQVLHVGRMAPNKCLEDIIKTFYFLHHHIDRNSRLWLVGIDIDTEIYSFALKRMVYELSLDGAVNFVNGFVDSEVKALYQNASVYLCMSEHEGFCMPVVEAMYFGLPVIAYASSALPDTIGNGGVLINHKRPAEVAELINLICSDSQLRTSLQEAGKKRVQELSYEKFCQNVKSVFCSGNLSQNSVNSRSV